MVGTVTLLAGCPGDVGSGGNVDAAMGEIDSQLADAQVFPPAGWNLTNASVGLAPLGKTCGSLPAYTGTLTPSAATTISDVRITGTLSPSSLALITIERSCIQGHIAQGNVSITDSEIVGTMPASEVAFDSGQIVIKNSLVHDVRVGIWFESAGGSNKAIVLENNVIIAGGIAVESQAFTGTNVTAMIRGNKLVGASLQSPVVYLATHGGNIANVTFERNLIEGPGDLLELNLTGGSTMTNMVATDNRFVGGTNKVTNTTWATWSENYMYSAGGTDGKGAAVPAP